jgi:hypothetical protein
MERAGTLIGKLKLSSAMADPEMRARAAWTQAAGEKIARHTRATRLVRGTLTVEVEDMIWQRQLAPLSHFLVRNLARILGEAAVSDIDFRPMPPRRGPQSASSARPSPAGRIGGADEADAIRDPVMRMLYRQSRGKG